MIQSFKHKGLRQFFNAGTTKGIQPPHAQKLSDVLDLLNAAKEPRDMAFPGSFLHPLKGKMKGYWSVRISGNWKLIFRIENGQVYDVDYIDYH